MAAKRDEFSITENPPGAMDRLIGMLPGQGNLANDALIQFAKVFADSVGEHIAKRAILNAPIKTGRLRRSIVYVPSKKLGTRVVTGKVRVHGRVHYAWLMHEYLAPHNLSVRPETGAPYNLGTLSRNQPPTPEGGVGGTYLSRIGTHHHATYQQALQTALLHFLSTGRAPRINIP